MLTIYMSYIRSIVEQSCTVWHSRLTKENIEDLERIQKSALRIILKEDYNTYDQALEFTMLAKLSERREKLCLKFANKAVKNEKHNKWFKPKPKLPTRQTQVKWCKPIARTDRLMNSSISYLTNLLNRKHNDYTVKSFKVNYSDRERRLSQLFCTFYNS